jgi:hypothetical protein
MAEDTDKEVDVLSVNAAVSEYGAINDRTTRSEVKVLLMMSSITRDHKRRIVVSFFSLYQKKTITLPITGRKRLKI